MCMIMYMTFKRFDKLFFQLKEIIFFSTPKSAKEEIVDASDIPNTEDKSLNDSCFDNKRKMAGELMTIDSIISLVRS